jgi:hypothetical protein
LKEVAEEAAFSGADPFHTIGVDRFVFGPVTRPIVNLLSLSARRVEAERLGRAERTHAEPSAWEEGGRKT